MKKVACVGILVADVIVEPVANYPEKGVLEIVNSITMHNGGNAMTAAINLRKLGVESSMVGMVGNDMFGIFLKNKLQEACVDIKGLKTSTNAQTSASVLMLDEKGERSFFHCRGTNAVFCEKDIDYSVIEECDAVFVTGTFLMDKFDGKETMVFLQKCKQMGKTTFLDVCWDATGRWGELLDMSMPYIDYLMPSIDEAVCIAQKDTPEEIADVFVSKGAKNVIIKLGSKGSYLRKEGEKKGRIFPPYYVENPVDTTGAGDSFCSGFLAAFARELSPEDCTVFGNATGSHCVTAKGATTGIKTYEETLEFINSRKEK
ncbi:MAG: carbohydrate kinase family protein [Ruminococcaceae bacterium]|nr:carbohydrate kinase family protein [Oscillospiraceae bacterium]